MKVSLPRWNTECRAALDDNRKLARILARLRRFCRRNTCRLCVTKLLPGLSKSLEGAWIFSILETPLRVTSRSSRSSLLLDSGLGNWRSSAWRLFFFVEVAVTEHRETHARSRRELLTCDTHRHTQTHVCVRRYPSLSRATYIFYYILPRRIFLALR